MKQLNIIVNGKVQGVYFRKFTKDFASGLNLKGYVRNLKDGSVEVVAEGEQKKLDALIVFLTKGPPGARVDDIDIKYEEGNENLDDFEIRY